VQQKFKRKVPAVGVTCLVLAIVCWSFHMAVVCANNSIVRFKMPGDEPVIGVFRQRNVPFSAEVWDDSRCDDHYTRAKAVQAFSVIGVVMQTVVVCFYIFVVADDGMTTTLVKTVNKGKESEKQVQETVGVVSHYGPKFNTWGNFIQLMFIFFCWVITASWWNEELCANWTRQLHPYSPPMPPEPAFAISSGLTMAQMKNKEKYKMLPEMGFAIPTWLLITFVLIGMIIFGKVKTYVLFGEPEAIEMGAVPGVEDGAAEGADTSADNINEPQQE
jgi:hypothetical protein